MRKDKLIQMITHTCNSNDWKIEDSNVNQHIEVTFPGIIPMEFLIDVISVLMVDRIKWYITADNDCDPVLVIKGTFEA